jgi:glycosyltransferase involved in cell wall biosynthesis
LPVGTIVRRPTRSASAANGPRRVAYLHDNVDFGGIETLQLEELRHLDDARYSAVVIAAEYGAAPSGRFRERLADAGIPLLVPGRSARIPVYWSVATVWKLQRMLRRERVDVVHIQTRTPQAGRRLTLASFVAGTPATVRTEHVSPSPHVARHTPRTVAPFDWMTDLIITDSKADRQEQIELVGRSATKVVTSYCGIDPFTFDPGHSVKSAKSVIGIDPDVMVVGTVGRLHEQKGHRYLVDAAARVVDHHKGPLLFLIVGDGPDHQALTEQVHALGLSDSVRFAGFQEDAVPYMEAMDVVVMPSLWEGFSISMQEFMALGKAMVVSDHHSFREAIDHGQHGLIVPMRDSTILADEIVRLLEDPVLRASLGAAAAERARREFSIERHTTELMDHYDAVLAARPQAARPQEVS